MVPLPLEDGVTWKVLIAKLAMTVQFAVTAEVVKVLPLSEPPQEPVTVSMWEPVLGASVNAGVVLELTLCTCERLMVPLPLEDDVTWKVLIAKLAMTVQFAVTAEVVKVLPLSEPPQEPVTVSMW